MVTIESMNAAGELWFEILWPMIWQTTVVALMILLIVRAGRRMAAPLRYGLLLVALLKFITPPVTDLPFGLLSQIDVSETHVSVDAPLTNPLSENQFSGNSPESNDVTAANDATVASDDLKSRSVNMRELLAKAESNSESLNETATASNPIAKTEIATATATRVPAVETRALSWQAGLLMMHLVGSIVFFLAIGAQLLRIRRQVSRAHQVNSGELWSAAQRIAAQLGLRSTPRVVLCQKAAVPYSIGLFNRVVVIPATLPEKLEAQHVDAVLFHELCHHRRFDLWVNSFQVLVSAVWWFNPLIWILCRELRSAREDCCDDLVLSTNALPDASYCEALVRVAAFCHGRVSLMTVTMADSRHPLASRMERVMDQNLVRRGRIGRVAALVVVVTGCLLLPGLRPTKAAPQDTDVEVKTAGKDVEIHGVVVDVAGQPVADAQVFTVIADRWSERLTVDEPIEPVRSSEDGSFRFLISPQQMSQFLANSGTETQFVAFKPGHGLGLTEFRGPLPAAEVTLTLAAPATARIRIFKPDGTPCSRAAVTVTTVRGNGTSRFNFSDSLQAALSQRSDENGVVQIDGLESQGVVGVSVEADDLGTQLASQYTAQESIAEIRLRVVGHIDGQLALEGTDRVDLTQVSLRLVTSSPDRRSENQTHYGITTVTPDENGRFTIPELASGDLRIFATHANDFAFRAVPPLELFLSEGSKLNVTVPLRKGVRFTRLILDERTKEPVVGARAHLQNGYQKTVIRSDAQGRFQSWLLPDVNYHTVYDLPPDYLSRNISADSSTRVSANGASKLSDVQVLKGRRVRGIVVDKDGTPQANLMVGADWVDPAEDFGVQAAGAINARAWGRTDDLGQFEIAAVHPVADVILTPVRTGLRIAEPKRFAGDASEPFRLTVDEFKLTSFSGSVVYRDGDPGRDLSCWLYAKADGKTGDQYGSLTHQLQTKADGTFQTPADLPLSFAYRVWVRSGHKEIGSSDWFTSASLQGGRIPPITVSDEFRMPSQRAVSFSDIDLHIVDSAGNAVSRADVVVWYTAARRRVSTNDQGAVRLSEVPPTGFWAFARADGFRFHGEYIGDTKSPRLTLRRLHEEVPAMPPVTMMPVTEAVRTLARDKFRVFAEKVFSTDNDENKNSNFSPPHRKSDVHRALATVDPDAAVALIGDERIDLSSIKFSNSTESYQSFHERAIRTIAARTRAANDTDSTAVTPEQNAARKREQLEADVDAIMDIDLTTKNAERLTFCAADFLDLNDVDRAKEVFDRARKMISQLPDSERRAFTKGYFAWQYAPLDHRFSLQLIADETGQRERNRYLGNIAHRIAAIHPAEAARVLEMIPEQSRSQSAVKVAITMASADSLEAKRIADSISTVEDRAYALGMMADGIHDAQPEFANKCLVEAFDLLEQHVNLGGQSRSLHVPLTTAVALLPAARRIDPDRFSEYFWQALSFRRDTAYGNTSMALGRNGHNNHLRVADPVLGALLSRYDSRAGKRLMMPPDDESLEDGYSDAPYFLLGAMVFVDPERAVRAADALPDETNVEQYHKHTAWHQVFSMLNLTPEQRWDWLIEHQYQMWQPGTVDFF